MYEPIVIVGAGLVGGSAALFCAYSIPGVEIEDPGVVSKSWPGYWEVLGGLQ